MIETKDSILFARPDGALVLFLHALRDLKSGGQRYCYCAAINGERVQCQACGVSVRVVAESRIPLRFMRATLLNVTHGVTRRQMSKISVEGYC